MNEEDRTQSVCPVCLKRIPARREEEGDQVFLCKECPDHGEYRALIWEGPPAFRSWKRPKIPTTPPVTYRSVEQGCPFDCGLCPDHRQRSCTVILEVTRRCNLSCAFCYADAGGKEESDPDLEVVEAWYRSAARACKGCHIQLSGGEPTLRDDLPEIVALGREAGFPFLQINTNGVRLGEDDAFAGELAAAGLDSVFLQFDALDNRIYRRMRGRDLLVQKLAAVEACARHNLGVVLVPTLVSGVNTGEIGRLVKEAMALSPVVRGIHFQPVSYFGRYPATPSDADRITLPHLMRALEEQTDGLLNTADFVPPGCENALCSFHATYLMRSDGELHLLGGGMVCCPTDPKPAEEGALRTVARVAQQWSAPAVLPMVPETGIVHAPRQPVSLDDFLRQARRNTFSVSAMAFQDAWNLDLERLRDCCIHIMSPGGYLVPFCAFNLTGIHGQRSYR